MLILPPEYLVGLPVISIATEFPPVTLFHPTEVAEGVANTVQVSVTEFPRVTVKPVPTVTDGTPEIYT